MIPVWIGFGIRNSESGLPIDALVRIASRFVLNVLQFPPLLEGPPAAAKQLGLTAVAHLSAVCVDDLVSFLM